MRGWPVLKLGKACRVRRGTTITQKQTSPGDVPVVGGGIVPTYCHDTSNRPAGTITISGSGASAGYVNRYTAPIFASDCSTVETDDEELLLQSFVFRFLQSKQDWINSKLRQGAAQPHVYASDIAEIDIPIPPLEEQRRIVAVLDEAFAAIATATANVEKNLANARELFDVQREQILRDPASGWLHKPLSDLCTIKHGFAFKSEYFCDSASYVLLTPGNFFEAGGYRDRGPKQKFYDGPIPAGFVLQGGDLLVAMTEQAAGLLGSPIIVPFDGLFLHNQRLGLVEPKPGIEWANEFFFHVFNTRHLRDQVHRTGTGQKVRHTSPGKIGDVDVFFPTTRAEQMVVASRLNELWFQIEQLLDGQTRRLNSLTSLKQSLLHRAFCGELIATAPDLVPA